MTPGWIGLLSVLLLAAVGCATANQPGSARSDVSEPAAATHPHPDGRGVRAVSSVGAGSDGELPATAIQCAADTADAITLQSATPAVAPAVALATHESSAIGLPGSEQPPGSEVPSGGDQLPKGGPRSEGTQPAGSPRPADDENPAGGKPAGLSFPELIATAASNNPTLQRLEQQVQAAWARTEYADQLPDPTVGASVFAHPIETAAGSQRASITIGQMIPWLERLNAQAQQACFEAMALQQQLEAERLRVTREIRTGWYRLHVLARRVESNRASQQLLTSLLEVANARVATGTASQGDLLLATLEISRLEEQQIAYRQQMESIRAELNRLAGLDAGHLIAEPRTLEITLPDWSPESLLPLALEHQPAVEAARLTAQATRWGVETARLKRRPNLSLNAAWFAIDDNRPASAIVDVGRDAWSVGAQVSIPLWRGDYEAREREAQWTHQASHSSVEEITRQLDSRLRDLWAQAVAAEQTLQLYQDTILPQARQTLEADQQAYGNGAVEFDRVVRDVRNVLALSDGQHQATGQLAITLARIEETVGTRILERSTGSIE